jgi:predicted AAA+ superfamily ATPase
MIQRAAAKEVEEALADTPVVLIHGPRQTGKSTLSQSFADRRYITLDDPIPLERAKSDPKAFLETYGWPLTIDEIQRAPELFLPIKAAVDRERVPGKYLLTGSANVLTLPKVADSLAGRMAIVDLLPFSQQEIEGKTSSFIEKVFTGELPKTGTFDNSDLMERIAKGGFPEPSLRGTSARRDAWFASYIRSLLERDVRDLANIEALAQLPRVLRLLAARSGQTLNVVSLSRDTGIPNTSLHRYLDLLQAVFLLHNVPAWSSSRETRLTKTPKTYLVDTGLLCYLDNLSPETLRDDPFRLKPLLENFVALELRKLGLASEMKPDIFHLRTVKQLEVDFVLEGRGGSVFGIDLKPATSLHPDDVNGLRFLKELAGDDFKGGAVLYLGNDIEPIDPDIVALPISALWNL